MTFNPDHNRDDEVKHVPLVSPEPTEIVDPFQDDLSGEDNDSEGIDKV